MSAREFVYAHEDPACAMHPMNVIDADSLAFPVIADLFVLPQVAKEVSLGHVYTKMHPKVKEKHDFESMPTHYLLMSEERCYTDWHQDYTGTAVRYEVVHGRKIFYLILPSKNNFSKFLEWLYLKSDVQRYVVNI